MFDKISIKSSVRGKCSLVKVTGFMDLTQVGQFEQFLNGLIQADSLCIVLDFSELEYICSAGLGAIISQIRTVRKKNGDIKIGGCSQSVKSMLSVFGFPELFSLTATPEEALALFEMKEK